jgi:broad specificity phosphatase PhoE
MVEWQKATDDRNYVPNQGVSAHAAGERTRNLLVDTDGGTERSILVVSHGGAISDFIYNTFDLRVENMDFCSVTEIDKNGEKFTLIRVNDIECWKPK